MEWNEPGLQPSDPEAFRAEVARRARALRRGRRMTAAGLCAGGLLLVLVLTAGISPLIRVPGGRPALADPTAPSTTPSTTVPSPRAATGGSRVAPARPGTAAPGGSGTGTPAPSRRAGTGAPGAPTPPAVPGATGGGDPGPTTGRPATSPPAPAPPSGPTTPTTPTSTVPSPPGGTTPTEADCSGGTAVSTTPVASATTALVGEWQRCGSSSLFGPGAGDVGIVIEPGGTWQLLGSSGSGGLVLLTGAGDRGTWRVSAGPAATSGTLVSFQPDDTAAVLPPWGVEFIAGSPEQLQFHSGGVTVDYESTAEQAGPERG